MGCVSGPTGGAVQSWDVERGDTYTLTLSNVTDCAQRGHRRHDQRESEELDATGLCEYRPGRVLRFAGCLPIRLLRAGQRRLHVPDFLLHDAGEWLTSGASCEAKRRRELAGAPARVVVRYGMHQSGADGLTGSAGDDPRRAIVLGQHQGDVRIAPTLLGELPDIRIEPSWGSPRGLVVFPQK